MRLAIIDLGTNSVRFDVHELGPDNQIYHLHREKLMIRLGEGVFLKGRLDYRASNTCLEAFESFSKTIEDFRVDRVVAFGTSALREARDSSKLIERIKKLTGIDVRPISGDEEARLIARGTLANALALRGYYALVDIGGGSTEISVGYGRRILHSTSFPLGTARLQQIFLKTIPPVHGEDSLEQLRRHIRGTLLYKLVWDEWPKVSRILGSSGTIRTLCRIAKRTRGTKVLYREDLHEIVRDMASMPRANLMALPGMEGRRVDMILSGAVLLRECMDALHADIVEPIEFSLRDGILDEQIEILKAQKKITPPKPLEDLKLTAAGMGLKPDEIKQSQRIAEELFDRMRNVHRLDAKWKLYFLSAALLHETGRAISPIDSAKHSAYIATFADIPAFEDWESALIAELCLRAPNARVLKKDLPFKKNKKLQMVFLKLLALLRISSALAYQRTRPLPIVQVRRDTKRVILVLSKRSHPEVAILRADQVKSLFEEVYKKALILEGG